MSAQHTHASTFYLAAASSNVEEAKARIAELTALGLRCEYDWTPLDKPEIEWPGVAAAEIHAAVNAHVFVALSPISAGVGFEIGVRLATWGVAHLVGPWVCPFAHHSHVIRHADWSAFMGALARGGVQ